MTGEYIEKISRRSNKYATVEEDIARQYHLASQMAFRRKFYYYGVVEGESELRRIKEEIILEMEKGDGPFEYIPEASCVSHRYPNLVIMGHKFVRDLPVPETREVTIVYSREE